MKLPTRNNCPECSEQYWEFRQSQANCRSIHAQDEYHHNNMDRRLKIEVFMIDLGNELLIKIGLRICLAERPMVSRRCDKKPKKKSAMPKEQRARTGSGIW